MENFDVVILGAGPAGYVGAIRAAQLGFRVALVEKDSMGGTCLNRGCIPTKALLHSAQLFYEATHNFSTLGIEAKGVEFSMPTAYANKNQVVQQLVEGIEKLLLANKIQLFTGEGKILPNKQVQISSEGKTQLLQTRYVLLATGARPAPLPVPGAGLPGVLNSDILLENAGDYQKIVIVGAGVIGVEFASFYAALGREVTLLEAAPKALAGFGREISQSVAMLLKKRGVTLVPSAQLEKIEQQQQQLVCHYRVKEQQKQVEGQAVLIAVGRKPCWQQAVSEELQLQAEKGFVIVNENYQTSVPWVYAAGDILPGMQLAHLASAQGMCAVEAMAGVAFTKDVRLVPSCVYTQPEIALVGLTEEMAAQQGLEVETQKILLAANGRNLMEGGERAYIKCIASPEGKLLGAELLCPRATDLVGTFALAIQQQLPAKELDSLVWAHPTFSEAIGEAGALFGDGAIHATPKPARPPKM